MTSTCQRLKRAYQEGGSVMHVQKPKEKSPLAKNLCLYTPVPLTRFTQALAKRINEAVDARNEQPMIVPASDTVHFDTCGFKGLAQGCSSEEYVLEGRKSKQ